MKRNMMRQFSADVADLYRKKKITVKEKNELLSHAIEAIATKNDKVLKNIIIKLDIEKELIKFVL